VGFEAVADSPNTPSSDPFIWEKRSAGVFDVVNQTDWLFSHSGMKIPSETLFEEVFKREIMQNRLLKKSGFGRYGCEGMESGFCYGWLSYSWPAITLGVSTPRPHPL
jgi:hypothetical protein